MFITLGPAVLAQSKSSTTSSAKSGAKSSAKSGHKAIAKSSKTMPVTTASPKARDLYQRAVENSENLYIDRAMLGWKAAVNEDPNFALAYAMLARYGRDPVEVRACRERAKELAPNASAGEQLLINWITDVQEGNYMGGIAAMNDMLAMFPRDAHLYLLAASWLMNEKGNEQAHRLLHHAIEIDPDYAPALNDMGYLHANEREFDEAIAAMEHYVRLLPKEPNPQDSYAEILRMAGHFDAALEHYHAALAIDPTFNTSQLGLGDTYALMGMQDKARVEYDKTIKQEHDTATRFDYRMQKATSYVREGNYTEADREFWRVASEAHEQSYELQEAQALRRMAQYAADDKTAFERLASAEDALGHKNNISQTDHDEELARILRVRMNRALRSGNDDLAHQALGQLAQLGSISRNRVIQACWHGATGEMLVAQNKFGDAVPELEEDEDDLGSLTMLAKVYGHIGATDKMKAIERQLRTTNLPTLEQALATGGTQGKASREVGFTLPQ
jgi:tetratricopeptide (TPR) repeat protein